MDFNLQNYSDLKAKGLVTIEQTGGSITLKQKQFDPSDGTSIADAHYTIDPTVIQNQINDLQTQINNLTAVLNDCPKVDNIV